jgi:hypothetical protein
MFGMKLSRFGGMVRRMMRMSVRRMRVVGRRFVIATLVMFRGLSMMLRRVFMVLCCLMVMFYRLLRHSASSQCSFVPQPRQ